MADNLGWMGNEEEINNPDLLIRIVNDLTELQNSGGKKYLDKFLRHQYDLIMAGIAGSPLASLDQALAQEYEKGRAVENLQFEFIVPNLIESFKEQIAILRTRDNEDE